MNQAKLPNMITINHNCSFFITGRAVRQFILSHQECKKMGAFFSCAQKWNITLQHQPSECSASSSSDLATTVTSDPARKPAIKQFPALYYQKITQAPRRHFWQYNYMLHKTILSKCVPCSQFDTPDLDYYSASVLNITFLLCDFGKRSLVTGEK